jgi:hypothetical protein
MVSIRVRISRWLDDGFPGFVECVLVDASRRRHLFVEKAPCVTLENISATSPYPLDGEIRATIVERRLLDDGRELVVVKTDAPDGVESTEGTTRFEVFSEQLVAAPDVQ